MIRLDPTSRRRLVTALFVCSALTTLSSCGGGGTSFAAGPSGGISGSGNSVGAIGGFGSVILNGREFNTTAATFVVETNAATQGDLRVGHVVVVDANFDTLRASRVEYRAQIKGPVQALTATDIALGTATLTVLGQAVATNARTNLSNASLDDSAAVDALAIGDLVEVSGVQDANGVLIASFLEAKAVLAEFKVIGRVTNLVPPTFRIGTLIVDYGSTAATPQAGSTVEVTGAAVDFNGATNTLEASSVEVLAGLSLSTNDDVEIEGYITRFASTADFEVNGLRALVDTSTVFEGGTAASLGLNVKVEVEGTINSTGILVADKVEIESTGAARLEGNVQSVNDTNQRLTVLGVTFDVRAETELDDKTNAGVDPLTFADINAGDRVEMRGFIDGVTVVASRLDREGAQTDARLRGRVTAVNASASTVAILGVTVTGNAATQYRNEADNLISQNAFFGAARVGGFVNADWNNFTSTNTPADELSLESD